MSLPNSPTAPGDRVFQFISDPDHKENLSGRVRAACLTCRRKKIKCSGELNCRTCQEKGLVCEGLPERKRSSRDVGTSIILGPAPVGRIERKRKPSKATTKRPFIMLNHDSEDSGYGSKHGEAIDSSESPTASGAGVGSTSQFSFVEPSYSGRKAAMKPRVDTWHLNDDHTATHLVASTRSTGSRRSSAHSPGDVAATDNTSPSMTAPLAKTDHNAWWLGSIDTTTSLEQQAQSLRLMKYDQPPVPHDASRRHTMSFPLPYSGLSEPRYDILQNQHGIFDDMALLLANRTPRTGMTPGLTEFSSLWDVDSFDFLASNPNDVNLAAQAQLPFGNTSTTQPMQELSCIQPTNDPRYIEFLWPG